MNIFEGGRRIAKAICALVVLIVVIVTAFDRPYISKLYAFNSNSQLIEVDTCGGKPSFYASINGVEGASAHVCGWESGPNQVDVPNDELIKLKKALSSRRLENIGQSLGATVLGLLIAWLFVWCIGWIVRGFLGIPRGQDYRITPAQK